MSSKEEDILKVLSEDLLRLEDIHACMVVRKNLEGIVPITEEFKAEITEIWSMLKDTLNEFFDIISHYSKYGLNKIYFELGKYDVIFFILPGSDTALVAIVPALANRGLLEVEMENARRKILRIIETDGT
jgi:predicted regulator of Ras-like GTPase activity (Roadblock/LC7/MglB family)